jgi:hypothetical protein
VTDEAVALFGTTEVEPDPRTLRAGPLEAVFDGAGLRWIRWKGVELVRAISFLVRDDAWRTPPQAISDLVVEEGEGRFSLRFGSLVDVGGARLKSRVSYEASAEGRLVARVSVEPLTDFMTNRTGFVVLHPLEGVAGAPVEVEHASGGREAVMLGATINPAQPLKDIREVSHEAAPGLRAIVRMEGDVFEMEDHRNWTDASFKTYSRPLALPFPYRLEKGAMVEQTITLTISDGRAAQAASGPAAQARDAVVVGDRLPATMPRIALAMDAARAGEALKVGDAVRDAAPGVLLALLDMTQGPDAAQLADAARLAQATGLRVALHLVIPGQGSPSAELAAASNALGEAGVAPVSVAVFPKVDEISFQPGQPRPPVPELADIYAAARQAFPGVEVGGGSPAYFPELNRKRPPAQVMDFVTHGGCATVHAADDASVMETLEAWPWIVSSTRAFSGDTPYRAGPANIGARLNPYGAAPADNPGNARVALARVDPRQRGVFAAAWHAGLAAALAPLAVPEMTVGAPAGPFGIAHAGQGWPTPGFEDAPSGTVYPLWHVVCALSAAAGTPVRAVSAPAGLAAVAWDGPHGPALIVANLTRNERRTGLEGVPAATRARILDAASFGLATRERAAFIASSKPLDAHGLALGPYAVAFVGC